MSLPFKRVASLSVASAVLLACGAAAAAPVQLTVTVENVAAANTVSFAPLHVGFHNGTFDAFNNGQTAGAAITSVAEGGSGNVWQADFAAADPTATRGTIGGALTPGNSTSMSFTVDPGVNAFFTFASMVIPSNDLFIGNDAAIRLFDAAGNLLINSIDQLARQIWDNGSEVADPANAAFIAGGVNSQRTPENGVVNFSFDELNVFNGLTTAAGYVFNNTLAGDDAVYRIRFAVQNTVPEPASLGLALAALLGVGALTRRRRSGRSALITAA
jgi:hypothetical protein